MPRLSASDRHQRSAEEEPCGEADEQTEYDQERRVLRRIGSYNCAECLMAIQLNLEPNRWTVPWTLPSAAPYLWKGSRSSHCSMKAAACEPKFWTTLSALPIYMCCTRSRRNQKPDVYKIDAILKDRKLTQVETGKLFGIPQRNLRGEFRQFSVKRLLRSLPQLCIDEIRGTASFEDRHGVLHRHHAHFAPRVHRSAPNVGREHHILQRK